MHFASNLFSIALALATSTSLIAQNALKDGTSLSWDKEIAVAQGQLKTDSLSLSSLSVPVYEAKAGQVWTLLKAALPGADFKKQGSVMKAANVAFSPAMGSTVDVLGTVVENKKPVFSTLSLAFLQPGTNVPVEPAALEPAMRELGVKLNKAVVQGQLDEWAKKLGKADSKTESAAKSQDKAQAKLEKITKEKSKLQNEHAVMQKEIDLYNQKWTLSQNPKDFKKLTKSRAKITKNEGRMAKAMDAEAKAQRELSKSSSALPDAQKAKDQKASAQAEVQRTVDALQRKLDSIR
ncbi:MAG TPA: hypothetical protein PLL18_02105 [Flavobacteriales bacterium]|nr:hypothetical protein [Flavobacteriales bacterium]